ncbi:type II toxin-antitoxin system HipA family toxin [Planctomycetes bacterium Poly30]|uniref:type II toxin-antitoxin system HipA family toxin n=1 Tax=Saltatorellus ferox TaxID=2528018 RepID=UPI0011A2127D
MRTLEVALFGERVGELLQTDSGRLEFRYDAAWVERSGAALSLSLPVRAEPFDHRGAEPFFGGLLPEEGVRDRVARYLGVSARNDFALLEQIGGECAGAVTLTVPSASSTPFTPGASGEELQPLDPARLAKLLDDLPHRPLLAGGERRLSLAGAQDKVAVSLVDGQVAIPTGDQATTHILKTPIQGFAGTVANELLCMRTARRVGLSVASAERRVASGREFLLVERFDRTFDPDGTVRRVHQEDMCQALGVPTRLKYQSEGGPSLPDCFRLLTDHARRPAVDRLALVRATAFNVLIGNADAHAKNFSLVHAPSGISLSPLYDLLSTLVYGDLSPRYAMKIGSKAEFKNIRARHWDALSEASGLAPAQVRRELREMVTRLPSALRSERDQVIDEAETAGSEAGDGGLGDEALAMLGRLIEETVERCEITGVQLLKGAD